MITPKTITVGIFLLFVGFMAAFIIKNTFDFGPEIKPGDKYLYSFDWDKPNPFERKTADTATVIEVKEGYVKYSRSVGCCDSMITNAKIKLFRKLIRPLK